jgi:predicted phage gp36 major capsid-like protein
VDSSPKAPPPPSESNLDKAGTSSGPRPNEKSANSVHSEPTATQAYPITPAAHAELKDRIKRAEAWVIWLTAAMALFALCSVVVGYFQWSVMNGQLGEMRSGSSDTKQLVTAAQLQAADMDALVLQTREQVNRTQELAERMKEQADQTKVIANEAKIQAAATQRTAEAARKSADTGQLQLELSERP